MIRGTNYLGIKAHGILGGFVELWVFQHILFPAGALKYSQSERRQGSEDLQKKKKTHTRRHAQTHSDKSDMKSYDLAKNISF